MANVESLIFDILAKDNASSAFIKAGASAKDAAGNVQSLTDRLIEVSKQSVQARVGLEGDTEAQASIDKLQAKLIDLGAKTANPNIDVKGALSAETQIEKVSLSLDKLSAKGDTATGVMEQLAGLGGGGVSGMGALIGAGVALAPVLLTVGTGMAGLSAAAYGLAKPIEAAAQKTGGLQANLQSLNPEQQQVAKGLLALGQQFDAFEKAVQPEVMGIFNQGLRLAEGLMKDIEPVTVAVGKAFEGFVGQIAATFRGGTWQQFFQFMARTAQPDVQALGVAFTSLLNDIPPLVEALQPVAAALLAIVAAAAKAAAAVPNALDLIGQAGKRTSVAPGLLSQFGDLIKEVGTAGPDALKKWILGSSQAATATKSYGTAATQTKTPVQLLDAAITALTADMKKNDQGILTNQQDQITWRQSLLAAQKQLDSNSGSLAGNSKNALANKQAVLQSTQAAQAFAEQEAKTQGGIGKATDVIQTQIRFLQGLHDKSGFAKAEIEALREEEARLRNIRQQILVTGTGRYSVSASNTPIGPGGNPAHAVHPGTLAAGTRGAPPGWAWVGERGPELVHMTGGETVLPHGTSMRVTRGYASGVSGSYSGTVPGLTGFLGREASQTVGAIDAAVAGAIHSAITSAVSRVSAALPGGGAPAANAALARRMMPAWGSGAEWAAWNAVAMAESGWNQFARNPSSGAYGIPQALPPGKMGAAANPPQSNPGAQIAWMISYIRSVYGDPIAAWAHEQSFHWYDKGGTLKPGLTLAYNGTGRNEQVVPPGGQKIVLEVKASHDTALEKFIVGMVQKYVIVHGGDAQVALGQRV